MTDEVVPRFSIRLSTELQSSEEEVVLSLRRDGGGGVYLYANATTVDKDGDTVEYEDYEFIPIQIIPKRGMVLRRLWSELPFKLDDEERLKIIDEEGKELKLVPAKAYAEFVAWREKKDKEGQDGITVEGIHYHLEKESLGVRLSSDTYSAGNLVLLNKEYGIVRAQSVNPAFGFPLNRRGEIKVHGLGDS